MSGKTEWIYCPFCGNKTRLCSRKHFLKSQLIVYCGLTGQAARKEDGWTTAN